MAKTCLKCGEKIGVFSSQTLKLGDTFVLCAKCSEPIKNCIYDLYYANNEDEFRAKKKIIINKAKTIYDDSIVNEMEKGIDSEIYKNMKSVFEIITPEEKQRNMEMKIKSHMMTTGFDFCGYKITKYLGVISGQVVLGTGFISDFTAYFADFFGEKSNRFSYKLEDAKDAAVFKMVEESEKRGGNGIIGVDFDYIVFSKDMIGVIANGTCVIIEKEKNN